MGTDIIKLLYKLQRCNDTAKRFFGENYEEKTSFYKKLIIGVMKQKQLEVLDAVLLICKDSVVQENGMAMMLIMSSAVDLIELEDGK